jgi:hypothetical protein
MRKIYLRMIGGAWLGGSVAIITGFSILDYQWWGIILPTVIFFIVADKD